MPSWAIYPRTAARARTAVSLPVRRTAPRNPRNRRNPVKRLHVHVSVADLGRSIQFYSTLFGTAPTVEKPDYAKWMLEDPRVNFAISERGHAAGVNHLGFQVDSEQELAALREQVATADIGAVDEAGAACCY